MVDLAYSYANARVKAMKSKLLGEEKIRGLLSASSIDGVIGMLEATPYRDAFVAESTKHKGVELVIRALERDLSATLNKIARISPKKMKPLLEIILKQWEVNNLKIILSSKAVNRPVLLNELTMVQRSPSKTRLYQQLANAPALEDAVKLLSATEYGPILSKVLPDYLKARDHRLLTNALDSYVYTALSKAAGHADTVVKEFVVRKIDAVNALTILRLKQAASSVDRTKKLIIPGGSKIFTEEILRAESIPKAVEAVCDKFKLGKAVLERFRTRGSLAELELEIERMLLERAKKTMVKSVLSPGAVLGYVHLKDYEIQSLRKIAFATMFEMKDDVRGTILAVG